MPADPTLYGARGRFQIRDEMGRFVQGGSGIEWVGLQLLDQEFQQFGVNCHMLVADTVEALAPVMEQYMKTNAPWDDRTEEARQGLKAIPVHDANSSSVFCAYSPKTRYGFFLENYTYNGTSYAIIRPTIEQFAQDMGGYMREAGR
jgi:hypothetical protein